MAKKKGVKKKSSKKTTRKLVPSKKKINLVLKNLILFVSISVVSFILYNVSNSEMFRNLFSLLAMIFGAVAFLIALLIFLFLKIRMKK